MKMLKYPINPAPPDTVQFDLGMYNQRILKHGQTKDTGKKNYLQPFFDWVFQNHIVYGQVNNIIQANLFNVVGIVQCYLQTSHQYLKP